MQVNIYQRIHHHVRVVQQENIVHDENMDLVQVMTSEYDETVMQIHIVYDEQVQQHVQHVQADIKVQHEQQDKQHVIYQYQHDNIYEQQMELEQQYVHHEHIKKLIM